MLNYDGKFAFQQWPPREFLELTTTRGQDEAFRPISIFTDTSERFTIMYADEARNITYVSQKVNIIGNGYVTLNWDVDTENTGAIYFSINGEPILPFAEANGAVFTVFTEPTAVKRIVSLIDVSKAATPQEGQFLQTVDSIISKEYTSTREALELAHMLKQLLISSPFSIYAMNEKRNLRILYHPFDFRLSANNKHHEFHWWNINKHDVPTSTRPGKDKVAFLACPVIIVKGVYLSIEDVIITSCYIRDHEQGNGSNLTAKQQICLQLHRDSNSNGLSPVLSQLDGIATIVLVAVEELTKAILNR